MGGFATKLSERTRDENIIQHDESNSSIAVIIKKMQYSLALQSFIRHVYLTAPR